MSAHRAGTALLTFYRLCPAYELVVIVTMLALLETSMS